MSKCRDTIAIIRINAKKRIITGNMNFLNEFRHFYINSCSNIMVLSDRAMTFANNDKS